MRQEDLVVQFGLVPTGAYLLYSYCLEIHFHPFVFLLSVNGVA